MLEIMRDNIDALGLTATEEQFDSTIAWTRDLLRHETVELSVEDAAWVDDLGTLSVRVRNKAGHKFPSGYPARRAWIEVIAHQGGDTLWHSGKWEDGGFLVGVDEGGLSTFEPHYTDIVEEDEVQVYELVAVDVTGPPTNVLERAAGSAKDTRLLPLGFSHTHPVYDTTRVEGAALMDDDFVEEAAEGLDRVHYAMTATPTSNANVTVDVRVWYQSMPARWVAPMFDIQDSTIQAFQTLFEDQGASPELVSAKSLSIPVVSGTAELDVKSALRVHPNPAPLGQVTVQAPDVAGVGCGTPTHLQVHAWRMARQPRALAARASLGVRHLRAARAPQWQDVDAPDAPAKQAMAQRAWVMSLQVVVGQVGQLERSPFSKEMWQYSSFLRRRSMT